MTKLAVVCRAVPSALEKQTCKLTRIERQTISLPIVPEQHRAYVQVFKDMIEEGHSIELPELSELPASVFVEDVSMLYSVCAVAPPGGGLDSGHGEGSALGERSHSGTAHCWRRRRAVRFEFEVHVCEQVDALEQVREYLGKPGMEYVSCAVKSCLHLRCAASFVWENTLPLNLKWIDPATFTPCGLSVVEADPGELEQRECAELLRGDGRQDIAHGIDVR
ncbi:hypothetical protein Q4I32_001427 [Leishmania shawi]|uniref:Uncharacterized protein n=1 Tax=Leishmania shawi TaxID=5680 RepID=A0AAW3C878_9TRYP